MRERKPDAYNYVILMSDGVANVDATNPFAILDSAGDTNRENPIRLITIGVGISNYNDFLLEQLAQYGDGWYRYLDTPEQARATFERENWLALSTPVADAARAQVRWNPDLVHSWRIVGYENRVTADENFEQVRREFAEVSSGMATTVFFEVEPAPGFYFGDAGDVAEVELRWLTPTEGAERTQSALVNNEITDEPVALLRFGAIVALAADRYSATPSGEEGHYGEDLTRLGKQLRELREDMGHLSAYKDFRFVLDRLNADVALYMEPKRGSGYSR